MAEETYGLLRTLATVNRIWWINDRVIAPPSIGTRLLRTVTVICTSIYYNHLMSAIQFDWLWSHWCDLLISQWLPLYPVAQTHTLTAGRPSKDAVTQKPLCSHGLGEHDRLWPANKDCAMSVKIFLLHHPVDISGLLLSRESYPRSQKEVKVRAIYKVEETSGCSFL